MYHINLLKKWTATREHLAAFWQTEEPVVDLGPQLSGTQRTELESLVGQFGDVFSELPEWTNLI